MFSLLQTYGRWLIHQLVSIFFWPTRLEREVDDFNSVRPELGFSQRFIYLVGILPALISLAILWNGAIGSALEASGVSFDRNQAWPLIGVLLAIGVLLGVIGGVTIGVISIIGSCGFLMAYIARAELSHSLTGATVMGVSIGAVSGLLASVTSSVKLRIIMGIRHSAGFSLLLGGSFGLILGTGWTIVAIALGASIGFGITYLRIATYPFEAALAIAAYRSVRLPPHDVKGVWWWCPIVWSELTRLPLPRVKSLLVHFVKQDRTNGFKQIAFVVAERPFQRAGALAALSQVVLNDLRVGSLSELVTVTEKLNWTTDAPADLPLELTIALVRFDRVAQHVAQYFTLNGAFLKSEALKNAVTEVGAIQSSLIAAKGDFAPALLQTANEWRAMLDAESERSRGSFEAAVEIPNPFVFGAPVVETEKNVFTGRRDIVQQVEASLLGTVQTPTLLLHGARRMGKTSILNQLPRLLGPDFAPSLIDCQNAAVKESKATLLRYLSRACSEGLRRRHVQVKALTAEILRNEPFAVFDQWLDDVELAMPEGMRVLLCLDEYEGLQETIHAGWGEAFLDVLRHTLQHRACVAMMFAGAHTFQELGPAWTDRFISARRVRVSFLERADVKQLLKHPIPEFDMSYAPGALHAIMGATNCQPFLTQAVAFELVQIVNERRRKEGTLDAVEQAIARALITGGEYFANVWNDAGEKGQAILRATALGETPPAFDSASAWLRAHDVLDGDGDFAVEMVKRWVRMKFS